MTYLLIFCLQDLEDELNIIQNNVKENMKHSSSTYELFTGKQYRKAIIIASGELIILVKS